MKSRFSLYLITLAAGDLLILFLSVILAPSATLVSNTVTLSTVNGGNTEYVASQATHSMINLPWTLIYWFVLTIIFWCGPLYRRIVDKNDTDKK